jgi:cytochrome P450
MTSTPVQHHSAPPSAALPLPPGPRGHFLTGSLPEFRRDMLGFFRDVAHAYGDIVQLKFLGIPVYLVSHPDYFKHVLQDNHRNYRRGVFFNNIARMVIGDNLFTMEGDEWLSRRRLMQPVFHRERIEGFTRLMAASIESMLARWDALADGSRVALDQEMMRLTLQVAGKALFSVDLLAEASALGDAFTELSEFINYRFRTPYPPPLFIPTKANRGFRRARRTLDTTVYRIIAERRRSGADHGDLLSMLMQARDADTGEALTDEAVHNEVALLMFAGHETTAVALTWTFYLLSQYPEVEAALHEEVTRVLGGRTPTARDLPNLPYTRMVIDESMRLYPPAWGVSRQSIGEDEIGGYRVPPNTAVTLSFINAHHDPRWWDDPERFDPLRFTPERSEGRPRFAYSPFGGGPRQCIGLSFALTEAQIVLAMVTQRYQLRHLPGHPVQPYPVFTLRTSHGMPMTLHRR